MSRTRRVGITPAFDHAQLASARVSYGVWPAFTKVPAYGSKVGPGGVGVVSWPALALASAPGSLYLWEMRPLQVDLPLPGRACPGLARPGRMGPA